MSIKPNKLNFNDYERVATIDELDGYQSWIVTPWMLDDGTQPPHIFIRKKGAKKKELIDDIENAVWNKDICIETQGTSEEYAKRVDWWFGESLQDEEFRTIINQNFSKNNFDVKLSLEKAISWLKRAIPSQRKSHLYKFIWKWFSKGYSQHLNFLSNKPKTK